MASRLVVLVYTASNSLEHPTLNLIWLSSYFGAFACLLLQPRFSSLLLLYPSQVLHVMSNSNSNLILSATCIDVCKRLIFFLVNYMQCLHS
jgi:hypothetical protein